MGKFEKTLQEVNQITFEMAEWGEKRQEKRHNENKGLEEKG